MPLKQINQLRSFVSAVDGLKEVIIADIALPGSPQLAVFCCGYIFINQMRSRTGKMMQHGKKRYFPCDPTIYEPTKLSATQFRWEVPLCTCGDGHQCYWNIFEPQKQPILEWSSLPHRCQPCPPVVGTGYIGPINGGPPGIEVTGITGGVFLPPKVAPYSEYLIIRPPSVVGSMYSIDYSGVLEWSGVTHLVAHIMIVMGVNETAPPYYTAVAASEDVTMVGSGQHSWRLQSSGAPNPSGDLGAVAGWISYTGIGGGSEAIEETFSVVQRQVT